MIIIKLFEKHVIRKDKTAVIPFLLQSSNRVSLQKLHTLYPLLVVSCFITNSRPGDILISLERRKISNRNINRVTVC